VILDSKPTTRTSAYFPPNSYNNNDFNKLIQHSPSLIAGDLNCKHPSWNSLAVNAGGNKLFNHSLNSDFVIVGPDEPTHYDDSNRTQPDVLDIAIFQDLPLNFSMSVLNELNSDHLPVIITINSRLQQKQTSIPDYMNANWELFCSIVADNIPSSENINSPVHIEAAVFNLTNIIQQSIK
jgi:hypothetical protein